MGQHVLLVLRLSTGDEPVQRPEGFGERGAFHNPRGSGGESPEVRHHGPVVLPLRADGDLLADHGRRHEEAHRHEVGRILDSLRDISDPGRESAVQQGAVPRGHGRAAPRDGLGLGPPRPRGGRPRPTDGRMKDSEGA